MRASVLVLSNSFFTIMTLPMHEQSRFFGTLTHDRPPCAPHQPPFLRGFPLDGLRSILATLVLALS
jgi:hypothetical protein